MSVKLGPKSTDKAENYRTLRTALRENLGVERSFLATLSNATAILDHYLEDINWVGFYLANGADLVLGPFQGKPACPRLKEGVGVCMKAYQSEQMVNVQDVEQFPGHIACDSASRSEIVFPIRIDGEVVGVLDIDAPVLSRFDTVDEQGLSACVRVIQTMLGREEEEAVL